MTQRGALNGQSLDIGNTNVLPDVGVELLDFNHHILMKNELDSCALCYVDEVQAFQSSIYSYDENKHTCMNMSYIGIVNLHVSKCANCRHHLLVKFWK